MIIGASITIVIFLTYGRCITFDFVNWDDDTYVLNNALLLEPQKVAWWEHLLTPSLGYAAPITILTYRIEYFLFGLNPAVMHATNVLLHVAVCLAIAFAIMRWTENQGLSVGLIPVVLMVTLFAVHPATAEPVAWISGRKELLVALFTMLGLAFAAPFAFGATDEKRSRALLAGLFIFLGFLSKPSAVLVPLLFVATNNRQRALWLALTAVGLALAGLAVFFESKVEALKMDIGPQAIIENVFASSVRHALILFYPFELSPKYIDAPGGHSTLTLIIGFIIVLTAFVLVTFAWLRSHPARHWLTLAILAYLPSSGIVPLNRQYADSYVYLPLAFLVGALGFSVPVILSKASRIVAGTLLALLVAGLSIASRFQAGIWKDGVSLWTYVYTRYPDSPQVCRNLGNSFLFGRRFEPTSAASVYRQCIETLGNRDFFLKNLAIANYFTGDYASAEAMFKEILERNPEDRVAKKYLQKIGAAKSAQPSRP